MKNNFQIVKQNKIFLISSLILLLICILFIFILIKSIIKSIPIKIGFVNTLTGAASTATIKIRDVAELAVDEINKKGGINGRKIELIIKDDKLDPETALQVDQELINEKVVAIIGHSFSSLALKVAPLINKNNILMICPTVKSMELTGLDDNFLRLTLTLDKDSEAMAKIACLNLKLKKIAVVYDLINPDLSKPTFNYFKKSIEENGGKITADIPINSKEEFSARNIVKQIIDSGSDGVYIISDAIHTSLICQHLRINNSQIKIMSHTWAFNDPTLIREGGQAVEGVIGTTMTDMSQASEKYKNFEKMFRDRYNSELSGPSHLAFEALVILFDALSKTTDPNKLKETILRQKEFDAIDGKIFFDEYGDPIRSLHIMEIQNGEIKNIGSVLVN